MPYGLKYQTQFTSQSDVNIAEKLYTLQFLFKDYTGAASSLTGAEVTVIQRCTVDDPVAPIKGQSLDIQLINRGNTPITVFQSDDDDGVQVILLDENNNVLFIGFLVQDDFYETLVDYNHPFTLSANDSLGLLKGVILSEAEVRRGFISTFRTNGVDTVVYFGTTDAAFYPQTGDTIEILGVSYVVASAVQEVTLIGVAYYQWTVTLTTTTGGLAPGFDTVYLTGEINLLNRNSLLSIIAICLGQTNLNLITNIFHNLYEYRQDNTITTFDQTLIDTQLFINGETYDDCYTVLTKIMTAYNCTIFQANGQWNIVAWHEARLYTNNAIPGFMYDETWSILGNTVFTNNFFIGPEVLGPPRVTPLTRPIAGLTQGALRGYKFTRKQFDYRNPKFLLLNADLKILGPLLRTYIVGTETWSEYELPYWQNSDINTIQCERFIRVIIDNLGNEVDRYIVIRGGAGAFVAFMVKSNNIETNAGDIIKLNFQYQTEVSQTTSDPSNQAFALRLYDGSDSYFARNVHIELFPIPAVTTQLVPPVWDIQNSWPSGTINRLWKYQFTGNTNQWQSVDMTTGPTPVSGLVSFFLANQDYDTPMGETRYKGFTFQIIPTVNDQTRVTGQIHLQERVTGPKLNQDENIVIDDSPRNSIAGTLFLTSKSDGLLQDRTLYWRYPFDANGWRLGELTTLQTLRWRQQTRSKLEGGFIGNYQSFIISLLTMAITDFNTNKNYTFGLLTIDYKRNQFSGTLWELYEDGQPDLSNTYTFTYIYATE